ncbi:testis, prostate and placenta-expressed protein-like isoform X2 [Pocillopora damicornis]|uniref:testis, prostate and placenta-expressed protein-like isoform X2 n=1 Tax=Pocillopora damicornis TaxID=46731 RepID=UPI000F558852|nr:testis, prostate and placenta-expressed protein-like isoform X2 [Pocillopora damicornis]XP_058973145.1 testis, prostate and placenta-expressed protein-like isoform X3 [Pocillopora verrucosa]
MPITTQTRVNPRFAGRSHMLASVKEGLYHPMLPTFRRMDMDTAVHKLPEEHSRTTTPLTREDFESRTITLFRPAEKSLSGTRITETGRQLQSTSYQPIESGGMAEFLKRSMTSQSQKQPSPLPPNEPSEPYTFMPEPYLKYSADQMKFNGYATRYLSPRETASWRYSLRQEPYIDTRGQRPIPATIYSRYRDAHPRASVAAMHWR